MTQEFFRSGASVEVTLREDPLAEDDDDLVVAGSVLGHDANGLLLDTGEEGEDGVFIPWSNVAQVVAVQLEDEEEIIP